MNKKNLGNKGISMLMVLASSAMLGGLMLVALEISSVSQKGFKGSITGQEVHDHFMRLRDQLRSKDQCVSVLGPKLNGKSSLAGIALEEFRASADASSPYKVGFEGRRFKFASAETVWEEEGNINIVMTYERKGKQYGTRQMQKKMHVKLWWETDTGVVKQLTSNSAGIDTSWNLVNCSSAYYGEQGEDESKVVQVVEASVATGGGAVCERTLNLECPSGTSERAQFDACKVAPVLYGRYQGVVYPIYGRHNISEDYAPEGDKNTENMELQQTRIDETQAEVAVIAAGMDAQCRDAVTDPGSPHFRCVRTYDIYDQNLPNRDDLYRDCSNVCSTWKQKYDQLQSYQYYYDRDRRNSGILDNYECGIVRLCCLTQATT